MRSPKTAPVSAPATRPISTRVQMGTPARPSVSVSASSLPIAPGYPAVPGSVRPVVVEAQYMPIAGQRLTAAGVQEDDVPVTGQFTPSDQVDQSGHALRGVHGVQQ